jgi:pimeloyl-ACP methyl ester carboxylesterase
LIKSGCQQRGRMMALVRGGVMARRIVLALLALLIAAAAAPYFLGDVENAVLDAEHRKAAQGQFAETGEGTTHYELTGPRDAQTVVLIHGLGSWLFAWDPIAPDLTRSGFRVLRYDVFGRGYSDRPTRRYDDDLLDSQLLELLQALDITDPVYLVGWSMGGAIAAVFADRHPEMVGKLALLAPAGIPMEPPPLLRAIRVPLLGEWMMRLQSDELVISGVTGQFYRQESAPLFAKRFAPQLQFKGYRRAILSTLRNYPLFDLVETYQRIGGRELPTLVIWGEDDVVLPVANAEYLRAAIPTSDIHTLDQAGHAVHFEEPKRVSPLLLSFFK